MATTMSIGAESWRDFNERVTKRETLAASRGATESAPGETAPRSMAGSEPPSANSEFVRRDEFRLFKWLGPLAIALVLGGFGLLYQQTSALRAGLEALRVDVAQSQGESKADLHRFRGEVVAELERLRGDMAAEIERLRGDMAADTERLRGDMAADTERLRGDMAAEIERLRGDVAADIERLRTELVKEMQRVRADLSKEIAEVRGRVVRVEARLDGLVGPEPQHAATE